MNKVIAIDIDNTVSDSGVVWDEFTELVLLEKGIKPVRKEGAFSQNEAYGIERGSELHTYIKKRHRELNTTNFKRYNVIGNAKNNLIKLKKEGYKLIFLSARKDDYFGDACLVTKRWFDYKGIPYDGIICNCEDKGEKLSEIDAILLVDDGLQYCNMAVQARRKAVYFYNENNKNKQSGEFSDENIVIARNWDEIYDYVKKLTAL